MKTETKSYDANFTAGGLLINEFKALEALLIGDDFESKMQDEERSNRIIGI